jgi:hypothetical protein
MLCAENCISCHRIPHLKVCPFPNLAEVQSVLIYGKLCAFPLHLYERYKNFNIFGYQAYSSRGNAFFFYLGGSVFESQLGH